jgi:hypothetical protein
MASRSLGLLFNVPVDYTGECPSTRHGEIWHLGVSEARLFTQFCRRLERHIITTNAPFHSHLQIHAASCASQNEVQHVSTAEQAVGMH